MSRRIVICLGFLLALCLVGDAIALVCLRSSIARLSTLAESHRIQTLRTALVSGGVRIERDLLATANGLEASAPASPASLTNFAQALEECMTCHHEESVRAGLDRLQDTLHAYHKEYLQLTSAMPASNDAGDRARALAGSLIRQASVMADQAATHLTIRSRAAETRIRQAWIVLIGTMAATLILGGLVALHLRRCVTAPLNALLDGTNRVRQGHVDYRFDIRGDVEFRKLGMAFNQANESLKSARESVIQAEKMAAIGKFAAGIAHEVGNPLASISSVAQMMKRRTSDPAQHEQIDLIMQHIARVSRIVRELLTFARPSKSDCEGRVEIGSVLDHAVSLLRYDKRAGETQIAKHYGTDLSIDRGDGDRLLLVFTNIMINAFDAMSCCRNGDAMLTITADDFKDHVEIRFEDNGPGMTEEQVRNAFEPFFTTKAPGAGTGLGLWICYQVIRRHDGEVIIESRPGEGTRVIVSLPCSRPARPAAPQPLETPVPA